MPERVPAYQRIAADFRARILSGALSPGEMLPSESELRETYGVSNTVVRNAILILKAEGLITGRQGAGVFVTDRR